MEEEGAPVEAELEGHPASKNEAQSHPTWTTTSGSSSTMVKTQFPPPATWYRTNATAARDDMWAYLSGQTIVLVTPKVTHTLPVKGRVESPAGAVVGEGEEETEKDQDIWPTFKVFGSQKDNFNCLSFCQSANDLLPVMGSPLVTGCNQGYVRVWNVESGRCVAYHGMHREPKEVPVACVDWSVRNPKMIYSMDEEGNLVLWLPQEKLKKFQLGKSFACPTALHASPHDDDVIAIGTKRGAICIVQTDPIGNEGCRILNKVRNDEEVVAALWCPKTNWRYSNQDDDPDDNCAVLASSGWTEKPPSIQLWGKKLEDRGICKVWGKEKVSVTRNFSPLAWVMDPKSSSPSLCTASKNGTLLLYSSGGTLTDFAHGLHCNPIIYGLVQCGDTLWSTSYEPVIVGWNLRTMAVSCVIPTFEAVCAIAPSPIADKTEIALGGSDGFIRVVDFHQNYPSKDPVKAPDVSFRLQSKITSLAWHPHKDNWIGFGTDEGVLGYFELQNNHHHHIHQFIQRYGGAVRTVDWGPSTFSKEPGPGKQKKKKRKMMTMIKKKPKLEPQDPKSLSLYACGSSEIVSVHPSKMNNKLIDVEKIINQTNLQARTGTEGENLSTRAKAADIRWSPDYALFAVGYNEGRIELYSAPHLRLKCWINCHNMAIQFLNWRLHDFNQKKIDPKHKECWIATASNDSTVRIFNLEKLFQEEFLFNDDEQPQVIIDSAATLRCPGQRTDNRIISTAWSQHDPSLLATVSYDSTAIVWNVKDARPIARYMAHSHRLVACSFHPTSQFKLITASDQFTQDCTVHVWDYRDHPYSDRQVSCKEILAKCILSVRIRKDAVLCEGVPSKRKSRTRETSDLRSPKVSKLEAPSTSVPSPSEPRRRKRRVASVVQQEADPHSSESEQDATTTEQPVNSPMETDEEPCNIAGEVEEGATGSGRTNDHSRSVKSNLPRTTSKSSRRKHSDKTYPKTLSTVNTVSSRGGQVHTAIFNSRIMPRREASKKAQNEILFYKESNSDTDEPAEDGDPEGISSSSTSSGEKNNCEEEVASGCRSSGSASETSYNSGLAMITGETDADESEMGRLQKVTKEAQQLLKVLQAEGDEEQQCQAVFEMSGLLAMGNETTLAGFPVKETVPLLIKLLSMEHNFDIMNHASRALTYMMEALPRSTPVVAEAVPEFLEKLQVLQCMDVAEQSLTALEMLSSSHAKTILQARGVGVCLASLDAFSITAQRAALSITANCCQNIHVDEFHFVVESLPFLASRLTQQDKKSVENVSLAFSRLVDCVANDAKRLEEIASPELLANLQQLLVVTPPLVSTGTFILVLRMLAQLCARSPSIAVKLLEQNIVGTLSSLLLGSSNSNSETVSDEGELVPRNPQELLEIVGLIAKLLPKLPKDGISMVNTMMTHPHLTCQEDVQWQWKDDRGKWSPYSTFDSHIIEEAQKSGVDEFNLSMQGRTYRIDFLAMQQINEDTGTVYLIDRIINPFFNSRSNDNSDKATPDVRSAYLTMHPDFSLSFLRPLFALLSEANSSSAGQAVRQSCVKTLLHIVHFLPAKSLEKSLKPQQVANNLASLLGSNDPKIRAGALKLRDKFMEKSQEMFEVHFRHAGVFHQISGISTSEVSLFGSTSGQIPASLVALSSGSSDFLQKMDDVTPPPIPSNTSSDQEEESVDPAIPLLPSVPQPQIPIMNVIVPTPPPLTTLPMQIQPVTIPVPQQGSVVEGDGGTTSLGLARRDPSHQQQESHCGSAEDDMSIPPPMLRTIITNLRSGSKMNEALTELRNVIVESDISSFEVNHSGLIGAVLGFLTDETGYTFSREERLRWFIHIFADCPLDPLAGQDLDSCLRGSSGGGALSAFVHKLNSCFSQLEQFQVKVHEVPAEYGIAGAAPTSAIDFFKTHQLNCIVQRHPACTNLKQWKGGPVKIDSLALVQTIERYLIAKGFGRVLESRDSGDSVADNSDDDMDDTNLTRHKLELLIGDHVLPYNLTACQAIFGICDGDPNGELDAELDPISGIFGNSGIWSQTHMIYYRPVPEEIGKRSHKNLKKMKKKSSAMKYNPKSKKDPLWHEGIVPAPAPPFIPYLSGKLPETVTINDPSIPVLALLCVIHSICRYWRYLYWPLLPGQSLLPMSEFINTKVAAKAQRQLQDPVVIMTGNLPQWLHQIGSACPFLFPFETRQLLFYSVTFDRDRALQRLLDTVPELNSSDREDRVTPRLDRRKRTISRDNILHHAEQLMNDFGSSRLLLEIQYENEVGTTGSRITLEFYALVSQELQKEDLGLWHRESFPEFSIHEESTLNQRRTSARFFPKAMGKATQASPLAKIEGKFKFMGKFMAKAVMDSRMIDLPMSMAMFKWILSEESSLCLADMADVDSTVAKRIRQLVSVVGHKKRLEASLEGRELETALESVTLDGCHIDNLGLDFTLPGNKHFEMRKGGKDIPVTIHNLEDYVKLVCYWTMIGGVSRQMEAWREGFDTVFPSSSLKMFYPEELEMVFCGENQSVGESWDLKTLMECCRPDHGYTHKSRAIQYLYKVMASYDTKERRKFVQFVTGSPRLPFGGIKALQPPLTIVRKAVEGQPDSDCNLPSVVMTGVNYLKLPDYTSMDIMRERLRMVMEEGQSQVTGKQSLINLAKSLKKKIRPNEIYEVEALRLKYVSKKNERFYLVKWKDWPEHFNEWVLRRDLNCEELLKEFDKNMIKSKHLATHLDYELWQKRMYNVPTFPGLMDFEYNGIVESLFGMTPIDQWFLEKSHNQKSYLFVKMGLIGVAVSNGANTVFDSDCFERLKLIFENYDVILIPITFGFIPPNAVDASSRSKKTANKIQELVNKMNLEFFANVLDNQLSHVGLLVFQRTKNKCKYFDSLNTTTIKGNYAAIMRRWRDAACKNVTRSLQRKLPLDELSFEAIQTAHATAVTNGCTLLPLRIMESLTCEKEEKYSWDSEHDSKKYYLKIKMILTKLNPQDRLPAPALLVPTPASEPDHITMEVVGISQEIHQKLQERADVLTQERKRKANIIPANLASTEDIKEYRTTASHTGLHSASSPGIMCLDVWNNLIVTGGNDKCVTVFNKTTEQIVASLKGHSEKVMNVACHPVEPMVMSGSMDSTARIWHVPTSQCIQVVRAHEGGITGLSLHATGDYLLLSSVDQYWSFVDLRTGSIYAKVLGDNEHAITSAKFHPTGLIFATGTLNADVKIWDVKDQRNVATFTGHGGSVTAIAFSESGYYLATAAEDSSVKMWDIRKLKKFKTIQMDRGFNITDVTFDYSGSYLVLGGTDTRVFSCKSWNEIITFSDHTAIATGVRFGPDADWLASTSMDRSLKIYSK